MVGLHFVLPFLAQKNWGKWTLYGDPGFWWQTAAETRNYVYAGVVPEREINERLTLGAELFGNSQKERGSRADVAFNLGGTWKLNEHVNLLFAGGRDIVGGYKRDELHRIAASNKVNADFIYAAKTIR